MAVKSLVFSPPILQIVIVLYCIALLTTLFRLSYRFRFRQLWWDDFWAFVALLNAIFLFGGYIRAAFDLLPAWLSSFPVVMVTSRLTLWCSRISVAVTIVRVTAPGKPRIVAKVMAFIFGLIAIMVVVQKAILCSPPGPNFTCRDRSVISGYTDLGTSFFADIWILAAPTYLLRNMKLDKQCYRLLQAVFATEILTLTTSIVHCVYIQKNNVQAQGVVSHFKCTVSLIVCNLLFLVSYIYRHIRNDQEIMHDSKSSTDSRQEHSGSYNRRWFRIESLADALTSTFRGGSATQRSTVHPSPSSNSNRSRV